MYAGITIADKVILSKTGLSVGGFLLFIGLVQGAISIVILSFTGIPSAPLQAFAMSFFGGFIWSIALTLMFIVLRGEEVSRVTPVWQTSPIFATLFAFAFLDEDIPASGWVAVLLVAVGAVAISLRFRKGHTVVATWPLLIVLVGAAMIGGAQNLLKLSAQELPVWENLWMRGFGLSTGMLILGSRPSSRKNLWAFLSGGKTWQKVGLFASESLAPFIGNLLFFVALVTGPISLVSALIGSRPVFVLAITIVLAVAVKAEILPESMGKTDIIVKLAGTAAIVGGVVIIAL